MNRMVVGILVSASVAIGSGTARAQAPTTPPVGPKPDSALSTPAVIDAGRGIFHGKGTCHACHGDKLQGGPVAPALTGPHWRHISGTFDAIVDRVTHGNPGTIMMPHPGGITDAQVLIVASYVYAVSHGLARP
jgi:mono/diheme cytochrome c family protein